MKLSQAEKGISNCAWNWVEYGKTVKDLTFKEAIEARNVQAQQREPMPSMEIPGLVFKPPTGKSISEEIRLAFEANKFASEFVQ